MSSLVLTYLCVYGMLSHMRTTLVLSDEVFRQAKQTALRTGRTLSRMVEDALRLAMARGPARPGRPSRLPVSRHAGPPRAGVNLDDMSDLLERMEGGRPATSRR